MSGCVWISSGNSSSKTKFSAWKVLTWNNNIHTCTYIHLYMYVCKYVKIGIWIIWNSEYVLSKDSWYYLSFYVLSLYLSSSRSTSAISPRKRGRKRKIGGAPSSPSIMELEILKFLSLHVRSKSCVDWLYYPFFIVNFRLKLKVNKVASWSYCPLFALTLFAI